MKRMIANFILWLGLSLIALGSIGYGFWLEVKREVLSQKSELQEEQQKAAEAWTAKIQAITQDLSSHSILTAKFGIGEHGLIRISETPIYRSDNAEINLVDAQKKLVVFQEDSLKNKSQVVFLTEINTRPYVIFIRKLKPDELNEADKLPLVFAIVLAEKFNFAPNDPQMSSYLFDDFGHELIGRSIPVARIVSGSEIMQILDDGQIASESVLGDLGLRLQFLSYTTGGKELLIKKFKTIWMLPLGGFIFSLLLFLIVMLVNADSVNEAKNRLLALEHHVVTHTERAVQQQLMSEREEAQKEMAEGVSGVLRTPISGIRTDINLLRSAASLDEAEERLKSVNQNLDRIANFVAALKSSSAPGKVAATKCDLHKVFLEFFPSFKAAVIKRGATVIDERVRFVGEVTLPARDARMIFKNLLTFMQNRASKDFKAKNIVLNLEKIANGARVMIIDNVPTTDSDILEIENDMNFLIAKSVLEKSYSNLGLALVGDGAGIEISCDIMNAEAESVSTVTKRLS